MYAQVRKYCSVKSDPVKPPCQYSPDVYGFFITYLASEEAEDITARVFYIGNGVFSVMEGWHRGPQCDPIADPVKLGPVLRKMANEARRNGGMDSKDLD